jgi:hypothetical protein
MMFGLAFVGARQANVRSTTHRRVMWNLICQAWYYGSAVDIDWPVPR